MKHLDQIPKKLFNEMKEAADTSVKEMIKVLEDNGICPVCVCHLIAEAAKAAAERLGENATTH
jgi:DNA repair exonuclease SbcCD ATPase subunit